MKEDIAIKWAEALESGEYTQARNALRTEDGFCCLGVLCDLYLKSEEKGQWRLTHFWTFVLGGGEIGNGSLPHSVMEWAGVKENLGDFYETGGETRTLAWYNDNTDIGFKGIAEIIRKHVKDL